MKWADILGAFDNYNRVARLYPALLTVAPVVWSFALLNPALLTADAPRSLLVIGGSLCLLYFFASIARSRGKTIEPKLISKWGGFPTTIILRHRDSFIDPLTKSRYHAALKVLCPNLNFPTVAQEQSAELDADHVYQSATRRLIESRRDPKYKLIHVENASYGFRRNLLGLKPIGIVIATLATIATAYVWYLEFGFSDLANPSAILHAPDRWPLLLLFALDVLYLFIWVVIIRAHFVRQAGFEYASALLRTLDL